MNFKPHRLSLCVALVISANAVKAEVVISTPKTTPQTVTDFDASLRVTPTGSIRTSGTAATLDSVFNTSSKYVTNYGQIVSTGGSAVISTTSTRTKDYGYYELKNFAGGVIDGYADAIRIDHPLTRGGNITFENYGTIRANQGTGLDLSAANKGVAFVSINTYEGSSIDSVNGNGIRPAAHSSIINRGSITAGSDAIQIGIANNVSVSNRGVITGRNGVSTEADAYLSNSGTITGKNGSAFTSTTTATVFNTGTLVGGAQSGQPNIDADGVHIAGIANVNNYSTIQSTGSTGVNAKGFANTSEGLSVGGGSITNGTYYFYGTPQGQLMGADNGILASDGSGGAALGATTLNNAGTVRGVNGYGVRFVGEFADHVTNSGLIRGGNGVALDMGGGDDTLTIKRGSNFEGLVDGGSGHNTLIMSAEDYNFFNSPTSLYSFGASKNFDNLEVRQGTWTLNGSGDFKNGAHVYNYAQLFNNGGIAGDVDVDQYASYGGSGTLGNLNLNGVLRTGTQTGAPQINGNLNMAKDSVLVFTVNPDGGSATTRVAGTANLNGANFVVQDNYDYSSAYQPYPWHSKYTVLEAGSINGTFGSIGYPDYAFLEPTLIYDAHKVEMTLTRNDIEFMDYAQTANGARAVDAIESIGAPQYPNFFFDSFYIGYQQSANPLYTALLNTTESTASHAIEQLAGSSNASLGAATLTASLQVGATMMSAMQGMSSGSSLLVGLNDKDTPELAATGVPSAARNLNDPNARGRIWLQGIGSYGKLDGQHGTEGLEQRTKGSVIGVDWSLTPAWRVGVLGGYSRTDLDSSGVDGKVNSWHVGAYAQRKDGPLALRLGAAYSGHDGESKRTVAFEGFSDRPKGDYDADSQQAFAELGYAMGNGRLNVEPFANLGYQRYHRDSYTEKGGAAALSVDSQEQNNFNSTFGVRLAQLNQLENGMSITPRGSLGWRRTYGEVASKTRQAFVLGGNAFNVEGTALDRNSMVLEAGLDIGISARHTLSVGYNGELGSNSRTHALMGQWQMRF